MLLGLELLLGILTLLDQEKVPFLESGKDLHKLIRVFEEFFVLIVRILDDFSEIFGNLDVVIVGTTTISTQVLMLSIASLVHCRVVTLACSQLCGLLFSS